MTPSICTIVVPGSDAGIFMPPIGGCARLGTVFGVIRIILGEQADLTVNTSAKCFWYLTSLLHLIRF